MYYSVAMCGPGQERMFINNWVEFSTITRSKPRPPKMVMEQRIQHYCCVLVLDRCAAVTVNRFGCRYFIGGNCSSKPSQRFQLSRCNFILLTERNAFAMTNTPNHQTFCDHHFSTTLAAHHLLAALRTSISHTPSLACRYKNVMRRHHNILK